MSGFLHVHVRQLVLPQSYLEGSTGIFHGATLNSNSMPGRAAAKQT